jgi:SAM-dependent methyltransferase
MTNNIGVKMKLLKQIIKEMIFISPLMRYYFPRYDYNMTASQLCFLCTCLDKCRDKRGKFIEIGCASGATTVFLNKYMDSQRIDKEYICIDTFSGFVRDDIEYEVSIRGKQSSILSTSFGANKKKWFDATMTMNNITRVKSIEADANKFDFSQIGEIAFCLLDVDLYQPTKTALISVFRQLSGGGMIVIDDCNDNNVYDGAYQAYIEFTKEMNIPVKIVLDKLGIIEKL